MTKTHQTSGTELITRQQRFTFSSNPTLWHQVKLVGWVSEQKKAGGF